MTFSRQFKRQFRRTPIRGGFVTLEFSREFSREFRRSSLVTVPPPRFLDQAERPKHPPHPPLWRRFRYPSTPAGLLLWKDGTVKEVESFFDDGYLTCDDAILGGHIWYTPEGSWQAQVLTAAGYTLTEYEGPT